MFRFTPSRDSGVAERALATLVNLRLDPLPLASRIRRLQRMSSASTDSCPPPWAAPGLQITPEITYQSEHWLPFHQLRPHYYSLYRHALTYPPILSSTPFAHGTSWAALVGGFPEFLKPYGNPADLLERLVADDGLRMKFLFWSFMPGRFYGAGSDRYPAQSAAITEWLRQRRRLGKHLRCLDAACGDGADTYGLARLCAGNGWAPESLEIEGWTLEPLEVWAAAYGRFPHDPPREALFREETRDCFEEELDSAVSFYCGDILDVHRTELFDLVLCNGLLGGPILNGREQVETAVRNLVQLLAPGGMLLAADHFHGGWKQKCPQRELRALLNVHGLVTIESAEGVTGLKPD